MVINKGYIGASRSVRSQEAIDNFEMPTSLISKDIINRFVYENQEFKGLEKQTISKIKYITTVIKPTSWHHTGKFYSKTDHYSLYDIGEWWQKNKDTLETKYKEHKEQQEQEKERKKKNYEYGIISVQIWGGTRKYPKIIDNEIYIGIIEGEWFNYYIENDPKNVLRKHNIYANKVNWTKAYNSYKELVASNKEFKGNVKLFNNIIKERNLKK